MLGFIIIAIVTIAAAGLYLVLRGTAKVSDVDLHDHNTTGPDVPETVAAARHHDRIVNDQPDPNA